MFSISNQSRKWWVLYAMGLIGGLVLLDETVIGVALPTIRKDLDIGDTTAHWVINSYLLVFTGFAAAGGKFCDIVGLKRTVLAAGGVLLLCALVAGFAENAALLIAARTVQGFCAALLFPVTLAAISIVFPDEQRGMAIGILAGIATGFLAAGPIVGGFLTDFASWRWIFWINIPVILVAMWIFMLAWTDIHTDRYRPKVDLIGLFLLVTGLSLFIFALMQGTDYGWIHPVIIATLLGGMITLVSFWWYEGRHPEPLIDVKLFRIAPFTASNLIVFISQYSKFSVAVFVALYLQYELKFSPFLAGLGMFIAVLPTPFMSVPSGKVADIYGTRLPALIGLSVITAATFATSGAMHLKNFYLLAPALLLWGAALMFCFVPPARLIMNSVPADKKGEVSGIAITVRLLGGTLGMTLGTLIHGATGQFWPIFAVNGVGMIVVLAVSFWILEEEYPAGISKKAD